MIIEQSEKLKKVLKDIIENKNFENEFNSLIINNDKPFTINKEDYLVKEGYPEYTYSNKFGKSGIAKAIISKNTLAIYTSKDIKYPEYTKEVMHFEYVDIAKQTGKSISTIKKWRKKIENLSGYEFTKTKARVSRYSVQVFFDFSKDEVAKFIELSKEIDKTKDLDSSIKKVWGDLNTQQAQSLEEDLLELEFDFYNFKKEINKTMTTLQADNRMLSQRLTSMLERLDELEDDQKTGFFKKFKK